MTTGGPRLLDASNLARLRGLAEQAARLGGQTARGFFGRALAVELKSDRSEVCAADHAAQSAIVGFLQAQSPNTALLAEETLESDAAHRTPARDQVCWVIDPLDGTRNFLRGIPLYACAVAAMAEGWPVAGAIYDPVRDTLYSASLGDGLRVNAQAHALDTVRPTGMNPKPVIAIPSSPRGASAVRAHRWLDRFVCRSFGSTALELAWVAAGLLDAALFANARLWDLAAGWILVTATGAHMTTPDGAALFPLDVAQYHGEELPALAGSIGLHEQLCR
jgi:myo-inositol-1(or 4)-monophosphatase